MVMVWLGQSALTPEQLGGKAYGINRMVQRGMPVPPAFSLTCDECARFHAAAEVLTDDMIDGLSAGIDRLERATGRRFGASDHPLLVSVRSGAARSMPGMMDTVLNLGMTEGVRRALAEQSGSLAFAEDTFGRFHEQFTQIVGTAAPPDPFAQLHEAVRAVFRSWFSDRAVTYRRHHGLDDDGGGGTAVTVQAMVFGNLDDRSGTGVLFTRNPLTGDNEPYGEWLPRGQGEDVVSGRKDAVSLAAFATSHPRAYTELLLIAEQLENEGRDAQDIEFTVESDRLYLLQTRAAKRSARAAVRIAVALHDEGVLSETEAAARVTPAQLAVLRRPRIRDDARTSGTVIARGEPTCPGIGTGRVVTSVDEAQEAAGKGLPVVLARTTTDPYDVAAMIAASAVVTEIGGATSHAAVVCRELDKPCVVGCGEGTVDRLRDRDVTVDGSTGEVFEGTLTLTGMADNTFPELARLLSWLDKSDKPIEAPDSMAPGSGAAAVDTLGLLQVLRLKGRPTLTQLAAALRADPEITLSAVQSAVAEQLVAATGTLLRITPAGRDRLADLVARHRESLDLRQLSTLYEEFDDYNPELKAIVTAWQLRSPEMPNDHTDDAYDAAVITRLAGLHNRFAPWLDRLTSVDQRLARYRVRLDNAVRRVQAGDHSFIARPVDDSYHTVWFELHEELMELIGRDRATEAAEGRAL